MRFKRKKKMNKQKQKGFTLTELLLVIAIIGALAGIILASITKAREKAQIAKTVIEVKELSKSIYQYYIDTSVYPVCGSPCDATTDPLLNDLGVSGWDGPYATIYNKTHPWGGAFSTADDVDLDGGGDDYVIILNDDSPGSAEVVSDALIPLEAMLDIDNILDDGDLSTGNVRGNALGFEAVPVLGEMMIKMTW